MFPTHHHLIGQNGHGCSRSKPHFYQNSPHLEMFDGEVEADESYFGGQRKGKRGRGAAGKVAVFGLLKRNGKVYTVTVPNIQTATLFPIIREQVKPDSIVYTDCYRSYDVLDVSEFSHFVSITARILLNDKTILMELRTFGTKQNVIYASLTAFPKSILSCI